MLQTYEHSKKKAINITVVENALKEARELGLNISAAAERGLLKAIQKEKAKRWREENKAAIDYDRQLLEQYGPVIKSDWMNE